MLFDEFVANPPREIVKYPEPILTRGALDVPSEQDLTKVCRIMFDLMYYWQGIGLSAPQVGLPYSFFIINPTGDPDQPEKEKVFINPKPFYKSERMVEALEGCLSLPGIVAKIKRHKRFMLTSYNLNWELEKNSYEGQVGRIVQHETSHLSGILIIDLMDKKELERELERINLHDSVLQECLLGKAPTSLKELYKLPIRNHVPWSLFPAWSRPDAVFEGAHEG